MEYREKKLEVSVHSLADPNMRVMRGKALLDEECADFNFVENGPRGPRSIEIGRTTHSRFVRRPDGAYTITLRCTGTEKYLRESLVAEIGDIVKSIKLDIATVNRESKKKEDKDGSPEG